MFLTEAQQKHWAAYYGKNCQEFIKEDEFWNSLFDAYNGQTVPLPMKSDTQSIWVLINQIECPPGKCGKCCHYANVPLSAYDLKRMLDNGLNPPIEATPFGSIRLVSHGNCPFLKDDACTIYKFRPEACFTFPLETGDKKQLSIRLLCEPALKLARKLITSMDDSGSLILPDLTII